MDDKFLYNNKAFRNRRRELRNNQTSAEKILWSKISKSQISGLRFLRQYSIGPYILDFYCPKIRLDIELDGSVHFQREAKIYDKDRARYLADLDVCEIRFWNDDVLKNTKETLDKLSTKIKKLIGKYESPSP